MDTVQTEAMNVETEVKTHQCCCVAMYRSDAETREVDLEYDQCKTEVEGSDNPFCYNCEGRHDSQFQNSGGRLGAVLNGRIVWDV
jgi:hypothetical protein